MTLLVFSGSILISCGGDGGDTPPPPPEEEKYINVNGVGSTDIVFAGSFNGKGGDNFKQYVSVVSNTPWSISGAPDWLSISPSNGNGTIQIEIYPTSENNTASPRTATVILSSSTTTASINVKQNPGKPLCIAEVANEVVLHNSICWEYSIDGKVNTFKYLLLSESAYNRMTDKEITEEINEEEPFKFKDDYISIAGIDSHGSRIQPNSIYYIITLATDEEGETGELTKKKVRTPVYKNSTEDAWVSFPEDDITCGSAGFKFSTKRRGYCNTYHLIYGLLPKEYASAAVLYAFEINYYIKYKKKHWLAENWGMEIVLDYPNDNTFYYTGNISNIPLCVAQAWGVFKDGTLSSDIQGFQWDTSGINSIQMSSAHQNGLQENLIIRRSVEEQKRTNKLK